MSFDTGFQLGAQAVNKAADRRTEQQRYDAGSQEREVDLRLRQTRLGALKSQTEFEDAARKLDAKNLVEADATYNTYEKEADAIDWTHPEAFNQYKKLQQRTIGGMSKNDAINRKYLAKDKVIQQTQAYIDQQTTQTDFAGLRRKMGDAGLVDKAAAIGQAVQSGQITALEGNDQMRAAMKAQADAHEELVHKRALERVTAPVKARNEGAQNRPGLTPKDHFKLARVKSLEARITSLDRQFLNSNTSRADKAVIKDLREEANRELQELNKPEPQIPDESDAIRQAWDAIHLGADAEKVRKRYRSTYGHELPDESTPAPGEPAQPEEPAEPTVPEGVPTTPSRSSPAPA